MKEAFKKAFKNKVVESVTVGLGVFLIFTLIVFPGLTAADSILNIVATLIGIFTLVFLFNYIDGTKLFSKPTIEPGETELDYIPKDEIVKKKRNPKQFDGVKSEEPFVKTRKKPNTNVTQKVMGEYQVNNSEKVRKSLIKKTK